MGLFRILFGLAISFLPIHADSDRPPYTEEERNAEYHRRGHTYPIPEFIPNTEGWTRLMRQRFRQVEALTNMQWKYDAWIETLSSSLVMPNFTEFGWGLTHAPQDLTDEIRAAIYEGLPNARPEGDVDVVESPLEPLFIDRWDLADKVSTGS